MTRRRLALTAVLCGLALGVAGAPGPAPAAECNGDECQGPPPVPEEVVPGTAVVQGPPNPPVRFPKSQKGSKGDGASKGKQGKKKAGKRRSGRDRRGRR